MTSLIALFGFGLFIFLLPTTIKKHYPFKFSLKLLGCCFMLVSIVLGTLAIRATPLNSQHIQQLASTLVAKDLKVSATCEKAAGFATWEIQYTLLTTPAVIKTTTYPGLGDVGCFLNTPSDDGIASLKRAIHKETPLLLKATTP